MSKDSRTEGALNHLADLCEKISLRERGGKDEILEFTKSGKYSPTVSRLAEAFGLMMARLDAHDVAKEKPGKKKEGGNGTPPGRGKENAGLSLPNTGEPERAKACPVRILGKSEKISRTLKWIDRIADLSSNVLITGETGTGKELVAKTIHYDSRRKDMPFIAINCAAVPEALFESEIFGIERGVATGVGKRIGKMEMANRGTLFFDEIADMPLNIQAKVLRVIEDRHVERLGSRKPIPIDIRIIAATNKNLNEEVREGRFREDLFYRLKVIRIHIPPLRERREDIPLLADFFLKEYSRAHGRAFKKFSRPLMDLFSCYPWPGNVRELRNEVERATALACSETITMGDFSENLREYHNNSLLDPSLTLSWKEERTAILQILEKTGGNRTKTAAILGITREGLRKKMKRLQLSF